MASCGNFSRVELFLSSREPFALPPPHLKKENRIITLQYQYIVKCITFSCSCSSFIILIHVLKTKATIVDCDDYHPIYIFSSSSRNIFERPRLPCCYLLPCNFLDGGSDQYSDYMIGQELARIGGKIALTGSQNSPPFCYLLPCNFSEDGSV